MMHDLDRIYTPWRYAYVTGQIKQEGCALCAARDGDDQENFILHRGRGWFVILNHYPYNNGHLLLVLDRHVSALSDCRLEELAELSLLLKRMEQTLQEAYSPHGINCGYNGGASAGAGIPEHLHFHMLPRWTGDTSFMTTIGDTRVMPETLAQTHARLTPILKRLVAAP